MPDKPCETCRGTGDGKRSTSFDGDYRPIDCPDCNGTGREPIEEVPVLKSRIALDFDGVLFQYKKRWLGVTVAEPPVPGALEFVNWLLDLGYEVFIFSSRATLPGGAQAIRDALAAHGFPPLHVTSDKEPADLYLDDRGLRFEGDFTKVRQFLNNNPVPSRWELT